jgi:hypothetical protein
MRQRIAILALVLGGAATSASAMDVGEGKLTLGGFGQWGYGKTTGENSYYIGNEDGEYENAQFSLAVTAHPYDDVVVAGQLFFVSEGEVALDWGFAEYRVNDLFRVRAGKVKNPFGLFMEIKDVGTLRPFFSLPQSVYGPTNIASEAYLGVGITGEWTGSSGWGLGYDLFGGALEMAAWEPAEVMAAGPPPFDFSLAEIEEEDVRDVVGGRLTFLTPVEGLTFRVSSYSGTAREENAPSERMTTYGFSAEYAIDRFQLRGEIFHQNEGDLETNIGGYAEVAWRFLPKLEAALRWEQAHMTKEGMPTSSPLRYHVEGAVGLSYWPRQNIAFKASFHQIEGNRLALPETSADDGSIDRKTSLFVAGTQFSF